MECIKRCEFQDFDGEDFFCNMYEEKLQIEHGLSIEDSAKIKVLRCEKCMEEGLIGSNTNEEFARKAKQHMGLMMDSFYSFKDDIESQVSHLYRLVKEIEDGKLDMVKDESI